MPSGLRYSEEQFDALRTRLAQNAPKAVTAKGALSNSSKSKARRKEPEHDIQVEFFRWVDKHLGKIPGLDLIHAVPNGGERHRIVAAKMKAEGVRKGVLDVQWPVARGGFVGLDIEFKAPDGNPSKEQRERIDSLQQEGWLAVVCWSWDAAARVVLGYAGLPRMQFDIQIQEV